MKKIDGVVVIILQRSIIEPGVVNMNKFHTALAFLFNYSYFHLRQHFSKYIKW